LLAATLPLAGLGQLNAQESERYAMDGDAVAVYNLAGAVTIEQGTGANVVVEVRRFGDDAAQLRIERPQVEGRPALVVRYPGDAVVYTGGRWSGRTTINVRADGTFFGAGGDRVTIRSSGSGTEAHADLRILVPAGKTMYVRLGVGRVSATSVNAGLDIDVASAAVVASGTRGNLRIDTGSGAVRVSDVQGDVLVDTGSGAVELNDVHGNSLLVDTGSGAVTGSELSAASIRVDTGSGRIALSAVTGRELELDTGSGGVDLELRSDIDRLRIDTGSGAVRLTVPASLGATIEAESGSGGVSVAGEMEISRRQRDHLAGRIGDGQGEIEIDTGSGGVRITRR
jgi:hypothetical protein